MSAERTRDIYKKVSPHLLGHFSSEWEQDRVKGLLHAAEILPGGLNILERVGGETHSPLLKTTIAKGLDLRNPVMLAAGWDKNGKAVSALNALGFSAVEVGTIPFYPQYGNPKPRQFVLHGEHGGIVAVNRLGFNSQGALKVQENIAKYIDDRDDWQAAGKDETERVKIGISLGKNKDVPNAAAPWAYARALRRFYFDGDYFVVNVSSPNTPNLRGLQDKGALGDIIFTCKDAMDEMGMQKPLFVKVAPDLSQSALYDVMGIVKTHNLAGIIEGNTTVNSGIKAKYGFTGEGGLSGDDEDFRRLSTSMVNFIYSHDPRMIIIGVGGVKDGPTALEKIAAGATAVQVLTGLRGEGPSVVGVITSFLEDVAKKRGLKNISQLRGTMNDC